MRNLVAVAVSAMLFVTPMLAQVQPFPADFTTRTISTNGAEIFVRVGGRPGGPAVVLLHGYGETGDMWAPLAAVLGRDRTVIVPDLRGMGLSSHPAGGYDKKNQARDLAGVLDTLKIGRIELVTHDIGNMVGYAFAAEQPERVTKFALLDAPVPGIGPWDEILKSPLLWHFRFGGPDMERLVRGRERIYLDRFWNEFSADPKKFDEASRRHYARLYARPGAMRSGFEQFKAFDQDAIDNRAFLTRGPLPMPVLAMGGEKSLGLVMGVVMRAAATNVRELIVPNSGHWMMEEVPQQVIAAVVDFLNRGSDTTPAYERAAARRRPEDPTLVWTPANVALMARELAPGVFAVFPDDATRKNAAGVPVATSGGFVIGTKGVLLVETMINRELAGQLLALVRERTDKPILYAVNTSYHGDHSYGNQFLPESTQVVQHERTQAYIKSSFAQDVAFMTQYFGAESGLQELRPQLADVLLRDGQTLNIDLGGKTVTVAHLGFAQTSGDLFVSVPADKVLFTGNPVISDGPSLPWLLDGNHRAALASYERLRARYSGDMVVVPGHGAPTTMAVIDRYVGYLRELDRQVAAAIAEGLDENATAARVGQRMEAAYGGYKIYPWVHTQLNVRKVYQESARPGANGRP